MKLAACELSLKMSRKQKHSQREMETRIEEHDFLKNISERRSEIISRFGTGSLRVCRASKEEKSNGLSDAVWGDGSVNIILKIFKNFEGLVTFEGLQLFREPRVTLRLPRRPARGLIKDKVSDSAATLERDGRVRNMRDILHFVLRKPRSLNTHIPITPSNSEFGTRLKASIYQADLPAILLLPTSHMHEIECGLLLKASSVDFEYNGVRHQKSLTHTRLSL